MTTLVFGAGFLGTRLASSLPGASLSSIDISDDRAVREEIGTRRPDAIVNAAGKTGRPNVDWCETHRTETLRANVTGATVLAEECARAGVYMLHLASGCIFNGASPDPGGWKETDDANPKAYYAKTKYAADLALSDLPNVGIVRLRMPIDGTPSPRNLITKLASYREVIDVENSVTVVDDFVRVALEMINQRASGIFHATNPGTLAHRDLLSIYARVVDPDHSYILIREQDLVTRGHALRPRSNCILSSSRVAELGITMRPIDVAVADVMRTYARSLAR